MSRARTAPLLSSRWTAWRPTYRKEDFPARAVYASRGFSALNLVTCGGEFDSRTRTYSSNVVAYSSLVAMTPAGSVTGESAGGAGGR